MCRRDIWYNTYDLFGVHRLEEWIYCSNGRDDQPCRRIYIHDHGDINMAPERPRSAGYDMPFGPRIIERKPESEVGEISIRRAEGRSEKLTFGFKFRDFFRLGKITKAQPMSILRRPQPEVDEPEYVELREPRRPRLALVSTYRVVSDDFVPLPPPVPSPRSRPEEATPMLEMRSPRRSPIVHAPSSPLRQHRRQRSPSPPLPVREVETIRIRRLDRTDRGKAERQRARSVEEEARVERERRHNAEDTTRHFAGIAMRESSERQRAERDAQNARTQRQSAEMAAAGLQRENERLDRARRLAEREAAVLERERQREQRGVRDALRRPRDVFRPARDASLPLPRGASGSSADRGAEVIRAAQDARRYGHREKIIYQRDGHRIEQDRRY